MPTFEPFRPATWQLPWLRVTLILRTMSGNAACTDDDRASMLALQRRLTQHGWFN